MIGMIAALLLATTNSAPISSDFHVLGKDCRGAPSKHAAAETEKYQFGTLLHSCRIWIGRGPKRHSVRVKLFEPPRSRYMKLNSPADRFVRIELEVYGNGSLSYDELSTSDQNIAVDYNTGDIRVRTPPKDRTQIFVLTKNYTNGGYWLSDTSKDLTISPPISGNTDPLCTANYVNKYTLQFCVIHDMTDYDYELTLHYQGEPDLPLDPMIRNH